MASRKALTGLPDHIDRGLQVLFVGINPGVRSAVVGHHFAGPSNRFWRLLFESRLVDEPLTFREDWRLPEWRLGLTNIIPRSSVGIDGLHPAEFRSGIVTLEEKVRRYQPRTIAFLGVTIFRILFPRLISRSARLMLGPTQAQLAGRPVFLLPNPSGRNAYYSYNRMLETFIELRKQRARPPHDEPGSF